MGKRIRTVGLPAALSVLCVTSAVAAGGSRIEDTAAPPPTPEQQANERYNEGLSARDSAWRLEKKLAEAPQEKQAKIEKKIRGAYEDAVRHFTAAVGFAPDHYQALGSLGYAHRQLGDYEQALGAYDAALELNPHYAEAIEYRAEAYLGLGRINEAQNAYRILAEKDAELAAELLGAMRTWIDARRADPAGTDTARMDGFQRWVEDRGEAAGVSSQRKSRSW
jgi:tetratricopeptide (TPR) repeat protein